MTEPSPEDRIQVDLTVELAWCSNHLEPFRPTWPQGYALATPALYQAFTRLPDVLRYCGFDAATGAKADGRRMQLAIREFGPMCCRVDPVMLRKLVESSVAHDEDRYRAVLDHIKNGAPLPE